MVLVFTHGFLGYEVNWSWQSEMLICLCRVAQLCYSISTSNIFILKCETDITLSEEEILYFGFLLDITCLLISDILGVFYGYGLVSRKY